MLAFALTELLEPAVLVALLDPAPTELPEPPVELLSPSPPATPLPLLELTDVSPAAAAAAGPVAVAAVAVAAVASGPPPAVIVTSTPSYIPKLLYSTVTTPFCAPVARMEPLQTPCAAVSAQLAVMSPPPVEKAQCTVDGPWVTVRLVGTPQALPTKVGQPMA